MACPWFSLKSSKSSSPNSSTVGSSIAKEKQGTNKHTSIHTKPAVHNSHNNTNNQNLLKTYFYKKGLQEVVKKLGFQVDA
jgi:hypothetical protein